MPDFSSCLYLGFRHASTELPPWTALTSGTPAALYEPAEAAEVKAAVALLQGREAAAISSSTLHLFMDFCAMLARGGAAFCVDAGAYPIAVWGAEWAAARGAPVMQFRHRDTGDLARVAQLQRRRLVVITDGFCVNCGRAAPLSEYLTIAGSSGWLLIDDTQAFGILGRQTETTDWYGSGGGGAARWCGVESPRVLVASSLSKAFGAPFATLNGPAQLIHRFEAESETRVHSSPPSAAALAAAQNALQLNARIGEQRRAQLLAVIRHFRARAVAAGFRLGAGLFPVQSLITGDARARGLHQRLAEAGFTAVLARANGQALVRFVFNALHTLGEVDRLINALNQCSTKLASPAFTRFQPLKDWHEHCS